jgi:prepilin-type N-terminal cleavage/methylation domain-containing protein
VSLFSNGLKPAKGFTLSELLVSLAVCALLLSFTVPKVLSSTQEVQRRSSFGIYIKILSEATGRLANDPPSLPAATNTTWHAFDTVLNSADDSFADRNFTLPGGGVVNGFTGNLNDGIEDMMIDVNGVGQPNLIGIDRVVLTACFNPRGRCALPTVIPNITVGSVAQDAGIVGPTPDITAGAGNVAFFNRLVSTS